MTYLDIAPIRLVRKDATMFTYQHDKQLPVGTIVRIPIGTTSGIGIVMKSHHTKPVFPVKPIDAVIVDQPLPQPLLTTATWMSKYYHTHLSQCLSLLLPRGIEKKRRARHTEATTPAAAIAPEKPTADQQAAIDTILASRATTHILFGITGSGKTLVYKKIIQDAVSRGASAIVLVPEIALTSQLVATFRREFRHVIVTHSRHTEAERHHIWQSVASAREPQVIIGPRSALFLPIHNLGCIVIDEFHEPSYKQDQQPRYSSLRVATILAKQHGAPAIFGSATPPITELYAAKRQHAPIIQLTTTALTTQKPVITIVDMTKRHHFTQHRFLSDALLRQIQSALDANRQSLIFHNRRGTATTTLCTNCGWSAVDPDNDIPLTLHADTHLLVSHITGYTQPVPTACPLCRSADIIHKGIGTKLLEQELRRLFPKATIARFDGDSDTDQTVERRYEELHSGAINIIIGTQVIAKGLDLPRLQTVGVVQADAGLALPDYTASERVFQLLAQVVGRVGRRDHAAQVIIQSYQPQHLAITAGAAQDYDTFYQHEIALRKRGSFPPFTYMARLVCTYKTEAAAIRNAKQLHTTLQQSISNTLHLEGPMPAFYEKKAGTYRWQIIAKSPHRHELISLLAHLPAHHWQYEIDPVSLI